MVGIRGDIAGNIKIHEPVTVVVGPGCSGAKAAAANGGLFGDVCELAITQVVIENIVP